ncbi:MAG: hypothetical protein ACR2PR_05425 [Pseudohongiellaceae bacterium]
MDFKLGFPWCECVLRSITYSLTLSAPWLSTVPIWLAAILSCLLLTVAWQDLSRLRPATRLRQLTLHRNHTLLHFGPKTISTTPPQVLLLWEIVLILRFHDLTQHNKTYQITIWPDTLPWPQQRHLRRLLRYSEEI